MRKLVRARHYLAGRILGLKNHIISICRLADLHFKQVTHYKTHWTRVHVSWLKERIQTLDPSLFFVFSELLKEYEAESKQIKEFDEKIEFIVMEDRYREKVNSLICYRGFSTLAAITVVFEVGDVHRFSHPRQLMGYAGLGVREYSSGGKEIKFGITKSGKHTNAAKTACAREMLGFVWESLNVAQSIQSPIVAA